VLLELIEKIRRMLKVSTKPSMDDFIHSLKITFLGITVVGVITYLVQFLALLLQLRPR
jgi:protein translocase SEC61 complex gamma subunit